jgi:L-lactate dehydrogenase (cytochrome)/(S)-mandelate dehydrogenase
MFPGSVEGFRTVARRVLPRPVFDYLDGGAESEATLRRNRAAWKFYGLLPRIAAAGDADADAGCALLGHALTMPVVLAPTGGLNAFWPDGECAVARAAASAGVLLAVSAGASTGLREVAAASSGPKWFQVCIYRDWGVLRDLLERARDAGYAGLCVTLDGGVIGKRERDLANRLELSREFPLRNCGQLLSHWRWTLRTARALPIRFPNLPRERGGSESIAEYFSRLTVPSPTWLQLARLRDEWPGVLVLKAVTNAADAARAADEGMSALIVSNHGGRQLDSGVSTLELLPDVVQAVRGRIPVLIDGGIARGTDVLKALALGVSACMIGRAHLWGLAVAGERGVRAVLEILRREIISAMQLCGVARIADLDHRYVVKLSQGTP